MFKKSRLLVCCIAFCLVVLGAGMSQATVWTLTDGNSTVKVDDASQSGMQNWTIDGTNQMYQQWFWYRIGNTAEKSLDSLPVTATMLSPRVLELDFKSDTFAANVLYALTGGTAGSQRSDVTESIRLTNLTNQTLDMHFFQYTDLDLNGTANDDTVVRTNQNTIRQSDPYTVFNETVVTPVASRWEIGPAPDIQNKLLDNLPTNLSNGVDSFTGDGTWAFQWDECLAPGGSFLISKDKNMAPVPEPITMLLFGSGLVGLGAYKRKKAN